jgi:hypothetical protein
LQSSPTQTVKTLPENERSFHVLIREEEKLYLLAASPQFQDVATVMLETGMRRSLSIKAARRASQ